MRRIRMTFAIGSILAVIGLASSSGPVGASGAPTLQEPGTCPNYDPNVDCWGSKDGWCPNHCLNHCVDPW